MVTQPSQAQQYGQLVIKYFRMSAAGDQHQTDIRNLLSDLPILRNPWGGFSLLCGAHFSLLSLASKPLTCTRVLSLAASAAFASARSVFPSTLDFAVFAFRKKFVGGAGLVDLGFGCSEASVS